MVATGLLSGPRSTTQRDACVPLVVLALLAVLPFLPALRGGYIIDDREYVEENPTLRSLAGLPRIWTDVYANAQYYPLVFTSFWVEFQLWGLNPAGYHLVNLLLHAACAVTLWRVLGRLNVRGAWLVAALWAVHPLNVDSVAWISERKNVLSTLFYLLAARAHLRFRPLAGPAPARHDARRLYFLALLWFVAALLCKTFTCSLPVALLLLIWWREGRLGWRDLRAIVPYVVLAAALAGVTYRVETHGLQTAPIAPLPALEPLQRVLLANRALCFYAGKVFWPTHLMAVYPRWTIDPRDAWSYTYPVGVLLVLASLWAARRRIGRGPLAAVLFFAVSVAPVLGLVTFGYMQFSFVADHFVYLSAIGLIALAVGAVLSAWARGGAAVAIRSPAAAALFRHVGGPVLATALIGLLASASFVHTGIYRDAQTLWTATLVEDPTSFAGLSHLGATLLDAGQPAAALPYLERAVRREPRCVTARIHLAHALDRVGRKAEGLRLAETLAGEYPRHPAARMSLGLILGHQGRLEPAIEEFIEVLRLTPRNVGARQCLALVLLEWQNSPAVRSNSPEASALLVRIVEVAPDLYEAHHLLVQLARRTGHLAEARAHEDIARRLTPAMPTP